MLEGHFKYTCVCDKMGKIKNKIGENCTKRTNTLETFSFPMIWIVQECHILKIVFFLIKSQTNIAICDTDNENPL